MLFTVLKNGIDVMTCDSIKGIYPKEILLDMQNSGYKFKLNDKSATIQRICNFIKEEEQQKT